MNNEFQRAIFDTGTLAYDRLSGSMSMMLAYRKPDVTVELEPVDPEAASALLDEKIEKAEAYEDEFEDEDYEDEFDDDEESEDDDEYDDEDDMDQIEEYLYDKKIRMTFYLNYIRHIDWYQASIGSDILLEQSRRRLLYLLDGYGDNLYQEDNFERAFADTSMEGLDYQEDFNDFYVMSRLFLVDTLEGWADDDKSLRKMLFVSTYYDLTGDKRIENIIHKYQETEIGKKVLGAILDHNYAAFDFSGDSEKKMIKTNQDDVQGKKDSV